MLRSAKSLFGYNLHESDSLLGTVYDLYFDDKRRNVRHVVAELGNIFRKRKVLIAGNLLGMVDPVTHMLFIHQSGEELGHDPSSDADKPVHQQFQDQAKEYYQWVAHWTPFSGAPIPKWEFVFTGDSHLRSVRHLLGYTLKAHGETVGEVEDFLVDTDQWIVPHFLVRRAPALGGKVAAFPIDHIQDYDWENRTLTLSCDKTLIADAPEYIA